MIEGDLRNAIVSLSSLDNSKVYFVNASETETLPYITMSRISGTRNQTHDGPDGTVLSRFQVNVFDTVYSSAKVYASEIYPLQNSSVAKKVVLENENDIYDSDAKVHQIILDFIIYEEE